MPVETPTPAERAVRRVPLLQSAPRLTMLAFGFTVVLGALLMANAFLLPA